MTKKEALLEVERLREILEAIKESISNGDSGYAYFYAEQGLKGRTLDEIIASTQGGFE